MKMKQMLYTFPFHFSDIASSHSVDEVSSQKTVITVPVEFNSHQRDIVSKCASNAGFNVSQVISEPAAAILGTYDFFRSMKKYINYRSSTYVHYFFFFISAYHIGQIDPLNAQKCLVFRCGGKSSTAALILVTGGMISVQHVVSKPIGGDIVTGTAIFYYSVFSICI